MRYKTKDFHVLLCLYVVTGLSSPKLLLIDVLVSIESYAIKTARCSHLGHYDGTHGSCRECGIERMNGE